MSVQIPDWYDQAIAWDSVVIQGFPLPGLSTATATAGRKIDVKSVRGQDGARIKDGGYEPATVEVECVVWDPGDLQVLSEAIESLQPRGGAARAPIQIQHPALAAIGISQVYLKSISAPVLDKGKLKTRFSFLEWTPQPPSTRSRAATTQGTPPGNETTAFEQFEQQQNSRNRPPATPPAEAVRRTRI